VVFEGKRSEERRSGLFVKEDGLYFCLNRIVNSVKMETTLANTPSTHPWLGYFSVDTGVAGQMGAYAQQETPAQPVAEEEMGQNLMAPWLFFFPLSTDQACVELRCWEALQEIVSVFCKK
jgi:hypothetical protein